MSNGGSCSSLGGSNSKAPLSAFFALRKVCPAEYCRTAGLGLGGAMADGAHAPKRHRASRADTAQSFGGDVMFRKSCECSYSYSYKQIPGYGHLPPRFVPRVVRAEWAWIPTSRAAATDALVAC